MLALAHALGLSLSLALAHDPPVSPPRRPVRHCLAGRCRRGASSTSTISVASPPLDVKVYTASVRLESFRKSAQQVFQYVLGLMCYDRCYVIVQDMSNSASERTAVQRSMSSKRVCLLFTLCSLFEFAREMYHAHSEMPCKIELPNTWYVPKGYFYTLHLVRISGNIQCDHS
jgi:hypothetical protein